ncbi:MAG: hypothetical protein K8H74_16635 [Notoacmeibacter sp.]|nr:hypothetical protein [Notoacmeibacter sp.]
MIRCCRASRQLARTIVVFLVLLPLPAHAQWRTASDMPALVESLETWLDLHAPWPRRAAPPLIRWPRGSFMAAPDGRSMRTASLHRRGYYIARSQTIYLVPPWSPRDARDVSVLLHELTHHRQAAAGHWYCPGAQELPAYRLQERWLNDQGLSGNINWIAVVLESGCTPPDIHPD